MFFHPLNLTGCEPFTAIKMSFQYSITDAGKVKSGAPSGVHDDCVIALALAAWDLRPSKEEDFWIETGWSEFGLGHETDGSGGW